jgi:pimeloyl-ACP methyl ester carboxylesterase
MTAPLCLLMLAGATSIAGLGLGCATTSGSATNAALRLTPALGVEPVRFEGRRSGPLAYYAAGPASAGVPPLVLVHSVNAAASSYEMRPLFDHYVRTRFVVALDLPGYGFSDRRDRPYLPALMRDAILDLVEQQLAGGPVDIIGLSLGCEFVGQAVAANPAAFRTLACLTPTGFGERSREISPSPKALQVLRVGVWRRALYDLLASRPSIRYFLQKSQATPVAPEMVDYAHETSHQPNAEFAPYYFLSFHLFTPTIFEVYRSLPQPALLLYGRDPYSGFEFASQLGPNWRVVALPGAGSLVHWDDLPAVTRELDALWADAPSGPSGMP